MELSRAFGIGAFALILLFVLLAVFAHPFLFFLIVALLIAHYFFLEKEKHARLRRYARMD